MKVINGFGTFALAIDWGIRKCAIEGCQCKTIETIISDPANNMTYGLCKAHYDEFNTPGPHNVKLDHFI